MNNFINIVICCSLLALVCFVISLITQYYYRKRCERESKSSSEYLKMMAKIERMKESAVFNHRLSYTEDELKQLNTRLDKESKNFEIKLKRESLITGDRRAYEQFIKWNEDSKRKIMFIKDDKARHKVILKYIREIQ